MGAQKIFHRQGAAAKQKKIDPLATCGCLDSSGLHKNIVQLAHRGSLRLTGAQTFSEQQCALQHFWGSPKLIRTHKGLSGLN